MPHLKLLGCIVFILKATWHHWMTRVSPISFRLGRPPLGCYGIAIVFLPVSSTTLNCGLAGLITIYGQEPPPPVKDLKALEQLVQKVQTQPLEKCSTDNNAVDKAFLGSGAILGELSTLTQLLKRQDSFLTLFNKKDLLEQLGSLTDQLNRFIAQEVSALSAKMGVLPKQVVEAADQRITKLKDVAWCLETEFLDNIAKVKALSTRLTSSPSGGTIKFFHNINTVLNSIDRLEVRGRDSAGISLLFMLDASERSKLSQVIKDAGLNEEFEQRSQHPLLVDGSITSLQWSENGLVGLTLTYKVAAEIGSLGDNVRYLRGQIANDAILHHITQMPHRFHTVSAHTRWASVGAITVANCHPVDNATANTTDDCKGIIHACLNGDIDNYLELKQQWEAK